MNVIALTDAGSCPGEILLLDAGHILGVHVALDENKKKVTMIRLSDANSTCYLVKETPVEIMNLLRVPREVPPELLVLDVKTPQD